MYSVIILCCWIDLGHEKSVDGGGGGCGLDSSITNSSAEYIKTPPSTVDVLPFLPKLGLNATEMV